MFVFIFIFKILFLFNDTAPVDPPDIDPAKGDFAVTELDLTLEIRLLFKIDAGSIILLIPFVISTVLPESIVAIDYRLILDLLLFLKTF